MSNQLLDYDVLSIIGAGSFGTCFKVKNKLTDKLFVWKAIDYAQMDDDKRRLFVSEINVLKQLAHPNIVKYFNHIINKETKTLYIIMECCEGGDLGKLIKRCVTEKCHFEEAFIWRCLYQLAKAVQGCHSFRTSLSILHRDIKPANAFLDGDGNIKLGDFGLARMLKGDDNFAETVVGTPFYMSPEIIKGTKYNRKSDIWSLGCLVYELCALMPPFTGNHFEMLSQNITDGRFNRIPTMYSCDLQKIISFMLSVDHGYRPTIEVILHHPTVVSNVALARACFPVLIPDRPADDWCSPKAMLSSIKIDGTFARDTTNDLRRELFSTTDNDAQSVKTFIVGEQAPQFRKASSDGLLNSKFPIKDPNDITQEIFTEALKQRLMAIRHRESKLKQQEDELRKRERAVGMREKQIRKEKCQRPDAQLTAPSVWPVKNVVGKRKVRPISYDATTLSIEPNDSVVVPTAAKFDAKTIPRPPNFQRKVSFMSPLRGKGNIENIPPRVPLCSTLDSRKSVPMIAAHANLRDAVKKSFIQSNGSKSSSSSSSASTKQMTEPKQRGIFSLFNMNFNQNKKSQEKIAVPHRQPTELGKPLPSVTVDVNNKVPAKWTAENKRTAFEMLALMNASSQSDDKVRNRNVADDMVINNKIVRHDRKRQSMIMLRRSQEHLLQ